MTEENRKLNLDDILFYSHYFIGLHFFLQSNFAQSPTQLQPHLQSLLCAPVAMLIIHTFISGVILTKTFGQTSPFSVWPKKLVAIVVYLNKTACS